MRVQGWTCAYCGKDTREGDDFCNLEHELLYEQEQEDNAWLEELPEAWEGTRFADTEEAREEAWPCSCAYCRGVPASERRAA